MDAPTPIVPVQPEPPVTDDQVEGCDSMWGTLS
jgi:hypothetical protein